MIKDRYTIGFLKKKSFFILKWSSLVVLPVLLVVVLSDKKEIHKDYVNSICLKIKRKIDVHLPCPEEIAAAPDRPIDRKALWSVIHTLCVPASYLGLSFPCLKVDRAEGYAIIRSPSRARIDFIITPTSKIEGIESLFRNHAKSPNLWRAGWLSRDLLRQIANHDLARDNIVMSVNSKATRSQDQLHLHLGCFNPKLREFIAAEAIQAGSNWRFLRPQTINTGLYIKFLTQDAINIDLFGMIDDEIRRGDQFAEAETIALAGVNLGSSPGFALMVTFMPVPAERFLAATC